MGLLEAAPRILTAALLHPVSKQFVLNVLAKGGGSLTMAGLQAIAAVTAEVGSRSYIGQQANEAAINIREGALDAIRPAR